MLEQRFPACQYIRQRDLFFLCCALFHSDSLSPGLVQLKPGNGIQQMKVQRCVRPDVAASNTCVRASY